EKEEKKILSRPTFQKLGQQPDRIFLHTEEEDDELLILQKEELQQLKERKLEAFSGLSMDSKGTCD
uniref:Uncharacterized protein n=1 Tax=Cucumis melo TaxID=3656 RepID=A0A9I9DG16_CUCME